MNTASPQYLSVAAAAERLAVSQKSIRRWIASGDLPAVRIGDRLIRIPESGLDALGRALAVPRTR